MDLDAIEWSPQPPPDFASLPTLDVAHHALVVVVGDDENERSMGKLYVESVAAVHLRGFRTLVAGVAGTADFANTTIKKRERGIGRGRERE